MWQVLYLQMSSSVPGVSFQGWLYTQMGSAKKWKWFIFLGKYSRFIKHMDTSCRALPMAGKKGAVDRSVKSQEEWWSVWCANNWTNYKIVTPADMINILPLLMTHCSNSSFSKADGYDTCKTLKLYIYKKKTEFQYDDKWWWAGLTLIVAM